MWTSAKSNLNTQSNLAAKVKEKDYQQISSPYSSVVSSFFVLILGSFHLVVLCFRLGT